MELETYPTILLSRTIMLTHVQSSIRTISNTHRRMRMPTFSKQTKPCPDGREPQLARITHTPHLQIAAARIHPMSRIHEAPTNHRIIRRALCILAARTSRLHLPGLMSNTTNFIGFSLFRQNSHICPLLHHFPFHAPRISSIRYHTLHRG